MPHPSLRGPKAIRVSVLDENVTPLCGDGARILLKKFVDSTRQKTLANGERIRAAASGAFIGVLLDGTEYFPSLAPTFFPSHVQCL